MNGIENILEQTKSLLQKLSSEIKEYCQDKTIDLDKRWNAFIQYNKITNDKRCYKGFIERFDCKLGEEYAESLEDRYSIHDVEDILEYFDDKDYDDEEQIIIFKENALQKFIFKFKFDW